MARLIVRRMHHVRSSDFSGKYEKGSRVLEVIPVFQGDILPGRSGRAYLVGERRQRYTPICFSEAGFPVEDLSDLIEALPEFKKQGVSLWDALRSYELVTEEDQHGIEYVEAADAQNLIERPGIVAFNGVVECIDERMGKFLAEANNLEDGQYLNEWRTPTGTIVIKQSDNLPEYGKGLSIRTVSDGRRPLTASDRGALKGIISDVASTSGFHGGTVFRYRTFHAKYAKTTRL